MKVYIALKKRKVQWNVIKNDVVSIDAHLYILYSFSEMINTISCYEKAKQALHGICKRISPALYVYLSASTNFETEIKFWCHLISQKLQQPAPTNFQTLDIWLHLTRQSFKLTIKLRAALLSIKSFYIYTLRPDDKLLQFHIIYQIARLKQKHSLPN